jgi:hypothetical protein
MKLARFTLIALTSISALAAHAAPVAKNQISAEANWFLHADIDQFKQTQIGKFVLQQLEQPDAQQKLNYFKALVGVDITKQLHGLTIYGQGNEGVLLIAADFDADRVVTLAKSAKDYQSAEHGKYTIHSWIDQSKNQRSYGAIAGGVVILGEKSQRVENALDVIDGARPNLKGTAKFQNLGASEKSAVLLGAGTQLPGDNPAKMVLKDVTSMTFSALESGDNFQAELQLNATNEETSHQIFTIVQGFSSLLAIQTDKPDMARMAHAISAVQNGNAIVVTLKLPVANSIQMIKDGQAKKQD